STATATDIAQAPVNLDSSLTITDAGGTIESASVKIAVNYHSSEDSLSYTGTLPSGVTANYNPSVGKLTFIGAASPTAYQTLLRTVGFTDSSATPDFSKRSIVFTAVDDQFDTDTAGLSLNVMANQAITFGSLSAVTYGVSPIGLGATTSSGLPVS